MPSEQTPSLPDRPSELVHLALADLAAAEANPRVQLHGTWWLRPSGPPNIEECYACLAGCVMMGTLGEGMPVRMMYPDRYGQAVERKLRALDAIRIGYISEALAYMDVIDEAGHPRQDIATRLYEVVSAHSNGGVHDDVLPHLPDMHSNLEGFKAYLLAIAGTLEELEL